MFGKLDEVFPKAESSQNVLISVAGIVHHMPLRSF